MQDEATVNIIWLDFSKFALKTVFLLLFTLETLCCSDTKCTTNLKCDFQKNETFFSETVRQEERTPLAHVWQKGFVFNSIKWMTGMYRSFCPTVAVRFSTQNPLGCARSECAWPVLKCRVVRPWKSTPIAGSFFTSSTAESSARLVEAPPSFSLSFLLFSAAPGACNSPRLVYSNLGTPCSHGIFPLNISHAPLSEHPPPTPTACYDTFSFRVE